MHAGPVAWIERSEIRDGQRQIVGPFPDFTSFNPGYDHSVIPASEPGSIMPRDIVETPDKA